MVLDGGSHTIRPMRMLMKPHCGNVLSVAGVTEAFDPDREGESYTRTLMIFENGQTATLEVRNCLSPAPRIGCQSSTHTCPHPGSFWGAFHAS